MIPARHTLTGKLVSGYFSGPKLDREFHDVRFHGERDRSGLPVLLLANHFSWWDGFIQFRLNRGFYGRKLHVMMLEEQLRRHMILNRCGCFSIRKQSRDVLESLEYCRQVMEDFRHMLLLFPQGEIRSMHLDEIRFESGLDYLMRRIRNNFRIAFNVNLPDYYSGRRPTLNVYFKTLAHDHFRDAGEVEEGFNHFYRECRHRQCAGG